MSDTKTRAVPKAAVVLTKAAEQRIADSLGQFAEMHAHLDQLP